MPIPKMDQWDGEGLSVYQAWLDGHFGWSELFSLHNEHRIVLKRILDLGLFAVTGVWSIWGQLALNALLQATLAVLVLALFLPGRTKGQAVVLAFGSMLVFGNPSGWQNALWGFQSQFYLCGLFGALAVWGMVARDASGVWFWLVGLGSLVLCYLSIASGVIFCAALLAYFVAGLFFHGKPGRGLRLVVCAALAAMLALELSLQPSRELLPGLHAGSVHEFMACCFRCLSYPLIDYPELALLMHLPACLRLAQLLRRRETPPRSELCAFVFWLVALLNAFAISYSRGGGLVDHLPLSRYQDTLLAGLLANLFFLQGFGGTSSLRRLFRLTWSLVCLLGLSLLAYQALVAKLPLQRTIQTMQRDAMIQYMATRDIRVLSYEPGVLRPHLNPQVVKAVLDDRRLVTALSGDPFKRSPWGSWVGPFVALAGLCLVLLMVLRRDESA